MFWEEYFMGFAEHAALKSKDETKVGAVLIDQNMNLRATAFNGPPRRVWEDPTRLQRPAKYLFTSHAEENLIASCAHHGVRTAGCSVYVTHMPCSSCARVLIQAGVEKVVYGPGQTSMPEEQFEAATAMFREAGVQLVRWRKMW